MEKIPEYQKYKGQDCRNKKILSHKSISKKRQEDESKRSLNGIRCSIFRVQKQNPGNGGVAQLGEHLPCKQGVKSSNLFISTSIGICKGQEKARTTHGLIAQQARARA